MEGWKRENIRVGLPTRNGRGIQPQGTASGRVRPAHRHSDRTDRSDSQSSALVQHIVRRLTGYDLATELLAFQRDIPDESWDEAKGIARLSAETEETLASFPITDDQAKRIAALLGMALPAQRMDYFLEPFAVPPSQRFA